MKIDIDMGTTAKGAGGALDLEELLATRLLVQGNSGSGKSHLLRRLMEQSAPWVQQCVIDPEGDFVTLADKFGHVVVEGARTEAELTAIAGRVRQHRVSAVLDLEGLELEAQMRGAAAFLGGLFEAGRDFWYPVLVVVDEAQMFAPAAAGDVSDEARKLSLGAMTNLMSRGRKRGLAGVIATQRLAKLAKNVAAEASNFLMGRTFLDIDMARAADLLGMDRRQAEMFRDLGRGHFVALGPALSRRPLAIAIGAVETAARSTSPRLVPLPETPADAHELIFTPGAEAAHERVKRTPSTPPPTPTAELLAQLSRARPEPEPASLFDAVEPAERDDLLNKAMAQLLEDRDAGFRTVAVLYQDFLVRCRINRVPGEPLGLPAFRRRLAVARAGVGEAVAAGEPWQRALALSERLADDVQGVFLIVAQAAVTKAPCPSDAVLARAYGTHSAGRARRLLTYFEEQGLVVVRTDFHGQRIVAFPDLELETAPGDPNGVSAHAEPARTRSDPDAAKDGIERARP